MSRISVSSAQRTSVENRKVRRVYVHINSHQSYGWIRNHLYLLWDDRKSGTGRAGYDKEERSGAILFKALGKWRRSMIEKKGRAQKAGMELATSGVSSGAAFSIVATDREPETDERSCRKLCKISCFFSIKSSRPYRISSFDGGKRNTASK